MPAVLPIHSHPNSVVTMLKAVQGSAGSSCDCSSIISAGCKAAYT
jgi:hypothetical protein